MRALGRLAITAAVLSGASAGVLWVTFFRDEVGEWISEWFTSASAAVPEAELAWGAASERDERLGRLPSALAGRSLTALKDPPEMLLGAYDHQLPESVSGLLALERELGETMLIVQLYGAWGDGGEFLFPVRAARALWALGSVPLVTWEPWLTAFDSARHPELRPKEQRERGGLDDIASGVYDFYIDSWAKAAADFEQPLMVRFAHEMNDSHRYPWGPLNNPHPQQYVKAFRHVVERFRAQGADNVLWVWAPSISYDGYLEFYPGDDYVDWVGTGVLNYGTSVRWAKWQSFKVLYDAHYPRLAALGKPVMIAEFGTVTEGGDRAIWYEEAFAELGSYPKTRSVVFFHVAGDRTVTGEPLDWSFSRDSRVVNAIGRGLRRMTEAGDSSAATAAPSVETERTEE